jgi:predicted RNA methylase
MEIKKYIYSFGYDNTESDLCKLESRCIFDHEEKNRLLCTDVKVKPSNSAFIKNRLEIICFSTDYSRLIQEIEEERICSEGFKVEYMVLDGDQTPYADRLDKLRDIGYRIEGFPDYYSPSRTYALCYFEGYWCFGVLIKNKFDWYKHKQKPCSYSNSIGMNIAKSLVNIAANGDRERKLLDACCGVGTIMLEACFAGFHVEGCDINWKICENARENLAYFNYKASVYRSDIKDISKRYDAAIIDLPYNLLSTVTEDDILNIIESSARITDRLVIVSTSDITLLINKIGFRISDHCEVSKKGKRKFARRVWVCEIER